MFLTDRFSATAVFQPVYACNPDTDALQIQLQLVARLANPNDPPGEGQTEQDGGQIGVRNAGGSYEFRYSPANNNCKLS